MCIDDCNFWYDGKSSKKVLYVCDRKQCDKCSEECSYTSNIDHAKNFDKEYGIYIEED